MMALNSGIANVGHHHATIMLNWRGRHGKGACLQAVVAGLDIDLETLMGRVMWTRKKNRIKNIW